MRICPALAAVLAIAVTADAYILSVPEGYETGLPGPGKQVPILIGGGETQIQSVTLDVVVPTGVITGLDPKTGTILGDSLFPVDPVYIASGGHEAYSDYSMEFGSFADMTAGKVATLTLDTTGLAPGTYPISLSGGFLASSVCGVDVASGQLVDGSFTVDGQVGLRAGGTGGLQPRSSMLSAWAQSLNRFLFPRAADRVLPIRPFGPGSRSQGAETAAAFSAPEPTTLFLLCWPLLLMGRRRAN